jgi:hypothetical protein
LLLLRQWPRLHRQHLLRRLHRQHLLRRLHRQHLLRRLPRRPQQSLRRQLLQQDQRALQLRLRR